MAAQWLPPAATDTDISLQLRRETVIIITYREPQTAISDLPHQNRTAAAATGRRRRHFGVEYSDVEPSDQFNLASGFIRGS